MIETIFEFHNKRTVFFMLVFTSRRFRIPRNRLADYPLVLMLGGHDIDSLPPLHILMLYFIWVLFTLHV